MCVKICKLIKNYKYGNYICITPKAVIITTNRSKNTINTFFMKITLLIIICTLCLIRCTYQQANKVAPLKNTITKGENFRITLPENHTTGFMWQINNSFDDKILDYYGSVFRGNEKGVDFNFTTLKEGQAILNFTLIKYRDTAEVKQFIIDVK